MRMQKVIYKYFLVALILVFTLSIQVWGEEIGDEILSDFDIVETDLRDVFRSLAEIGNMNVVLDPSVKGEATVKLKHGITVKEAMEMLAQTYGYSYRWVKSSRTMLVGNEKTFSNFEAKETRIYQFSYANIEQVADALKVIIPKDQIGIDKRTNQLTVRASLLEHQNISEIAIRLDREMPQINIEARVEEVSQTASKELGISWTTPNVSVDLDNLTFTKPVSTATVKALEEQNKAKLLANPNISTTDSQEGKIFIGDKYPIITSDVTDKGITYKIEYIEIGTILTVIPRINENDIVTVTVKAVVSSIQDWKTAGNNEIPVIRTREASSVIRLKEGETFVLSGLNMNKNTEAKTTTPGLAKIPLIGALFTSKTSGPIEDSEIVIFLTPKIVRTKQIEKPIQVTTVEKKPEVDVKTTKDEKPVELKPETITPAVTDQLNTSITETKPEVAKEAQPAPVPAVVQTPATPVEVLPAETAPVATNPVTEGTVKPDVNPLPSESVNQPPTEQVQPEQVQTVILPSFRTNYRVKANENIAKVAEKFGVSVDSITQANNLGINDELSKGKELIIPMPANRVYTLKPKETLWRLAKRYGTTVEILMELNNLSNYTNLEIGQQIILPVTVDQVVDSRF